MGVGTKLEVGIKLEVVTKLEVGTKLEGGTKFEVGNKLEVGSCNYVGTKLEFGIKLSLAQISACCVCIGHCSLIVKDQPSLSQHKARLAHTVCHGTHHPPTTKLVTYFLATLGN